MSEHGGAEFGLVMPFVVEPDSPKNGYVLGWEAARINAALAAVKEVGSVKLAGYYHTANVEQFDLIAMQHGFAFTSEPWADAPGEWSWCEFNNAPSGQWGGTR